jgi:rod shape determining protein RodA
MFARLDWPVFLLVLALCGAGLLNVYSGTRVFPSSGISIFYKQLVWILLGLGVFFLFYFMGSGLIEEMAWHVFIAVVALLLFVLLIGKVRGGAQRWLSLGFLAFQPSEFAKPAVGITLIPFLLVALQPDLGTAGVFLIILGAMMVVACIRGKVFLLVGAVGTAVIPCLWFMMKDYQKQRVLTFLAPGRDPLGAGSSPRSPWGRGDCSGRATSRGPRDRFVFSPSSTRILLLPCSPRNGAS